MGSKITKINLADVPKMILQGGSWSSMLITSERVPQNRASLGYSFFTPGSMSDPIAHETEELVFVVRGKGDVRTDEGTTEVTVGDSYYIPPWIWHWIANTGNEDLVMVFSFPVPEYPSTQRRSVPADR